MPVAAGGVPVDAAAASRLALLEAAVARMSHGLMVTDRNGTVTFVNERYLELYRLPRESVHPGVHMREVVRASMDAGNYPGASFEDLWKLRSQRLALGRPSHLRQHLPDGRRIEVHFAPMPEGGWVSIHDDVTLQARFEEEIEQQNRRFDAALENMSQGLAMYDAEQRLIVCNRRYLDMFHMSAEVVRPGATQREIFEHSLAVGNQTGRSVEEILAHRNALLAAGEPVRFLQQVAGGGTIETHFCPMAGGGWVATYEDVTERRRDKLALTEQNRRFDAALANMSQGLVMFDAEQRLIVHNAPYCEMHGLDPALVRPGMTLRELVEHAKSAGVLPNETVEETIAKRMALVARGDVGRLIRETEDGRAIAVVVTPTGDGGWLATYDDVTPQRRIEAALREQNRRFDAALANMSHGLAMFDAEHRLIVRNQRYCELHGLDPAQVVPGITLRRIVELGLEAGLHHDPVDEVVARRLALVATGERGAVIQEMEDGRALSIVVTPTGDGGWVATYEDVTPQRRIEAERREHSRRLDAALANMSQGLAMYDSAERLIVRNERYVEILGLDPSVVRPGISLREVFEHASAIGNHPGRTVDEMLARRRAFLAAGRSVAFIEQVRGREISIHFCPMPGEGWIATYEDVTDRLRMEADLRAQNLRFDAALENMTQGLAMFDADERLIVRNLRYCDIFRLDPDVVVAGTSFRDILSHAVELGRHTHETIDELYEKRMAYVRRRVRGSFVQVMADGTAVAVVITPMDGGGWVATYEDVTAARRAEALILEQNSRFDAALENMSQGLAMFDADERLIVRNMRYCELFGISPDVVKAGITFHDILVYSVGLGRHGRKTAEEVYSEQIEIVRRRERTTYVRILAGGMAIAITITPMVGGGWVATYEDVTAARETEALILEQNLRLDAALDNMSDGLVMYDEDLNILLRNRRYYEIYGLTEEETQPGQSLREVMRRSIARGNHPEDDADAMFAAYKARLEREGEHTLHRKLRDGRTIEITQRRRASGGWVMTYQDITAQLRAEEELKRQNLRFDAALDHMAQGLCMIDKDFRVIVHNRRWRELFEIPSELTAPGTSVATIAEDCVRRGLYAPDFSVDALIDDFRTALDTNATRNLLRPLRDGRVVAVSYSPMGGEGIVATYEDVTDSHRAQQRIAHMARHDALTGLVNRTVLTEQFEADLALIGAGGEPVAVMCIDLDKFKLVNDTFGHAVGDQLLRRVVERLGDALGPADTFARLGGDEFAILQRGGPQPKSAEALARRLVALACAPFEIEGRPVHIGASIGVAVALEPGLDASELMRNADLALYRAKADGRGAFRFFRPEMDEISRARRRLEVDLRQALAEGAFELHFQPQLDIASGAISGFEALLRWRHPERGLVPPGEFVALAEEIGIIGPIGEWVLRNACAEAARWPGRQRLAVNFSAAQFRDRGVVPMVVSALASAGLEPTRLEVEITETVLLADDEQTSATLRTLRELGVRLALDDFGTGYSSLSLLRTIPLDKIKIDRSFVHDLDVRPDCAAIVRAIIGIGRDLGLTTTAEGIETEAQAAAVRELGCAELQGYLIGRPVPASALGPFLGGEMKSDTPPRRRRTARRATG